MKNVQTNSGEDNANAGNNISLLEKFFIEQLKDIYFAEEQLLKVFPDLNKACSSEELEDAFTEYEKQCERHIKRLEKAFNKIGITPSGKKCEAIEGLIKEAKTIIQETKDGSATRDAALIIAAQKIQHYAIATYGGLVQLAITMKLDRVAELLERSLDDEEQADKELTHIAEAYINVRAEQETPYSWEKLEPATS